jgi:uncharacterized protein
MGLLFLLLTAGAMLAALLTAGLMYRLMFPPRHGLGWALAKGYPADPGALGTAYVDRHFTLRGGGCTAGWVVTGGRPDGPMVIASHGWGENRHAALGRAATLLPHVAALVCYDLRGHGESTRRRCDWAVAEAYDLHVMLDQLQADGALADARPVVLLGYSMGAAASLLAATDDPGRRIAGVVGEGVGGARLEPIAAVLRLRKLPVEPMLTVARLLLQATRCWPRHLDMLPWMHKVACPVLLLHGRDDRVCSLEAARRIAQAIPDAELRAFATDAHLDLAQVDPDGHLQTVLAFFSRLTPSPPPETAAHEPAPRSV